MFMRENKDKIDIYGKKIREIIFEVLDKYKYGGEENLSTEIFILDNMYGKKQLIKKEYPGGLGNFMNFVKKKVYAVI